MLQRPSNFLMCYLKRPAIALAFLILTTSVQAGDKASAPAAELYNKAVILYQKGRWGAAKEYLHTYLAEYSDTPLYTTCLYYLAYCYQQLGNKREAASLYHKVIDGARGGDAFWGEMAEVRLQELVK
jgi:outer membrane protein assembly factor BamD (BamD/ComL family)